MNDEDEQIEFETEPDVDIHANVIENEGVRARLALQMLKQTRDSMNHVIQLLEEGDTARATRRMVDFASQRRIVETDLENSTGSRMIEGVFDGQYMVGADGVRYPVSENYASKSKLVEGDMLKLITKSDGTSVFKQIGPIDRKRITGKLAIDSSTRETIVICGEDVYKVLAASVTYFKGIPGDEVVVLVPSGSKSVWAAVEGIR